jgi:hypothetical protein
LKIKNTESSKGEQTEKRQQLIAPFHFLSCRSSLLVTPELSEGG